MINVKKNKNTINMFQNVQLMKQRLLIVLLGITINSFAQVDTTTNLSDKEKIVGLSKFWSEAANNFVYFDRVKINWDSAYEAFIPKVLATKNTWNYYNVLKEFAALLKDGHTDIQEPFSLYNSSSHSRYKFINIENVNKHFFVTNIDKNDNEKSPLGSELLSVNEIPLVTYLQTNMFPYICASTEQQRWNDAARFMFYGTDSSQTWQLKLKTPRGKLISYNAYFHTYPRNWQIPLPEWKRTTFKKISDIGYFQINTFGDEGVINDFKEILPELRTCKGVILDIRKNGGGNTEIGAEILKYFTDAATLTGSTWQTRENLGAFKAWGAYFKDKNYDSLPDLYKKSVQVYRGNYWYHGDTMQFENHIKEVKLNTPLVVLTGNSTASAAEDFLIILSNLKNRATTIGQTTFGSTGQPLQFDMPGGGFARVCAKKDTYPNGKEFVGYGITPDITVEKNINDIINGQDTELKVSLKEISKQIK